MKRYFKMIFVFLLILSVGLSPICKNAYASETEDSKEEDEAASINLLKSEEDAEEDSVLEDTGVAYDLIGLSGSPDIVAESATVMDARSGEVIYAKQAEAKRYPASITKVMTTLLAIENCKMDEIVSFTSEVVNSIEEGSSTAGINAGAELTMEDTLYALMLVSANEAGAAVADHIAGSNDAFAKMMTDRAKELGCKNTNFRNPHGLPDEQHYTTAHDMGLILKEALKHDEFRKFAGTITYTIKNDTLTNKQIELWNHAKILRDNTEYYYKYAKGAKTGYTMAASNTLVTYAEKDGMQLVCVILKDYGADQSYYDTIHLFKWAFDTLKCIHPLKKYDLTADIKALEGVKPDKIETYISLNPTYDKNYPVLVKKGFNAKKLSKKFRLDEDFDEGRLGYIEVKSGDKMVLSRPVTYDKKSNEAINYVTDQGGGDDLQVAKTTSKNPLWKRIVVFLLRIIVAAALIFVIMQMIRRWQLERKRQARIQGRQNKTSMTSSYGARNKKSSGSTGTRNRNPSSGKTSSSAKTTSSGRTSSSDSTSSSGDRSANGRGRRYK